MTYFITYRRNDGSLHSNEAVWAQTKTDAERHAWIVRAAREDIEYIEIESSN